MTDTTAFLPEANTIQAEATDNVAAPKQLRRPTARQVEAVYSIMRLLRRDRPVTGPEDQIWCDACHQTRARNGSASYGTHMLCNGCATDYELLRLARSVHSLDDFLRSSPTH